MINEHLREFIYMAEMAKLYFQITTGHDSINFQWDGYNDSMKNFLVQSIQKVKGLENSSNLELIFNQAKEQLL